MPMPMQAHPQYVPSFHTYTHTHARARKDYYLKSTNDIVTSSPYAHVSLATNALVSFTSFNFTSLYLSIFASVSSHARNNEIKFHGENNNFSISLSFSLFNSVQPKRYGLRFCFAQNSRLFAKETFFTINAFSARRDG